MQQRIQPSYIHARTCVAPLLRGLLALTLLAVPFRAPASPLPITEVRHGPPRRITTDDQALQERGHSSEAPATSTNVLWLEDWEGDWANDWHADAGTWEAGVPTSGPGRAYAGENVAATVLGGDYSENVDSRMVRHTTFVVPATSENPRLRFWHWYSFSNSDTGYVQIKTEGGAWETVSTAYVNTGSNVWTSPLIDLSPYAGSTVQLAFYFQSRRGGNYPYTHVSSGWYVDDVALVTGPMVFNNPEDWENGMGDWWAERGTWEVGVPSSGAGGAHSGNHAAATVLGDHYHENVDSRLLSPSFVVPAASESPRLRFWHWYSFSNSDTGYVQIKAEGGAWETILGPYTNTSSDVWTRPFYDLASHTGATVQLAFFFRSRRGGNYPYTHVSSGWYVDDVRIEGVPRMGIAVIPDSLNFGDFVVGETATEHLRVSNAGSETLNVNAIVLSGADADQFEVDTTPFALAPGASRLVAVRFAPQTTGLFNAVVTFDSNGGAASVNLYGGAIQIIASNPIYMGELASGYDMGVNTSGGRTDWIAEENGAICMAYPSGQAWGAVFITVGEPIDPPRPSQDLSNFQKLSLELRGAAGGEEVLIGLKDNTDPDDGRETKIAVSNLTTDWQPFEFPLSDFATADLTRLYVVTEFVFEQSTAATVCFRNIQYVTYGQTTLSAEPSSLDFGDVKLGESAARQVSVSNTGSDDLHVTSITLSGAGADQFGVDTTPFTLAPGAHKELAVHFTPTAIDSFHAVLTLESDNSRLSVNLFGSASTGVATEADGVPGAFVLHGAYPNPFNPATTIRFDLPETAEVTLIVFDVLGRQMQRIEAGRVMAGTHHEIRLEAGRLASGTYFYRLEMRALHKTDAKTGNVTLVR